MYRILNRLTALGRCTLTAALALLAAAVFIAAPAAAQTAGVNKGYTLGIDDAVDITVYGAPEASVKTKIKHDGTVVLPMVGAIQAAGQTNVSLAAVVAKKLEAGNYFKNPIVNIEILGYSSQTVNVTGKINAPGSYPLDKPYRVLDVLTKAGWINGAGARYVYLHRASDGKELRLETEALARGGADKNPLLENGDTLYVPDAEIFYIYGQIARPGQLPIAPGMTLREAIALAGGVTASGSDRKVALYRAGAKEVDADIDQQIQKNDVYVVKERLF